MSKIIYGYQIIISISKRKVEMINSKQTKEELKKVWIP